MTNLLTLSTMREIAPTIYEMLTRPLDLLTPKQVDALLQVRQLYVQAREAQWQGLREQYGDERMDACERGTVIIKACRAQGHDLGAWQDLDGTFVFQHGRNETALRLSREELATWPYADGPVGIWIERVHRLTNWWETGNADQ